MPLPDSVEDRAVMFADFSAGLIHNRSGWLLAKLMQQEIFDADFADKANSLAVFFVSCCELRIS